MAILAWLDRVLSRAARCRSCRRSPCDSAAAHGRDPLAVLERRPGQAGDRRVRAGDHRRRAARSSCRPTERIATFDQDGTLWVEHPMYTQVMYCLDRVPAVVKAKPRAEGRRAVQDRAVRQPRGDREALR